MSRPNESEGLWRKLSGLPRAVQWLMWAALGTALLLVWDQFLAPIADEWNQRADRIQNNVKQVRDGEQLANQFRGINTVVTSLGPVEAPEDQAAGSNSLNDAVISVVQKHGAANSNFSFSWRSKGKINRPSLALTKPNQRVERLTADVKFDSTPQVAAAIIADLESSPDVEAIESVRLVRDSGGKVKAHVTVEAWVLSTETPRGGPVL
ncbi:MAG: hypothetical protein L0Y44_00460 [Phycisphaerales bacterium]|nr:hypothetical protein [Phycisphaerales bacterium]MCI0675186.1 hypothetical protein [Phycisphaerales bacterium]